MLFRTFIFVENRVQVEAGVKEPESSWLPTVINLDPAQLAMITARTDEDQNVIPGECTVFFISGQSVIIKADYGFILETLQGLGVEIHHLKK